MLSIVDEEKKTKETHGEHFLLTFSTNGGRGSGRLRHATLTKSVLLSARMADFMKLVFYFWLRRATLIYVATVQLNFRRKAFLCVNFASSSSSWRGGTTLPILIVFPLFCIVIYHSSEDSIHTAIHTWESNAMDNLVRKEGSSLCYCYNRGLVLLLQSFVCLGEEKTFRGGLCVGPPS